MYHWQEWKLVSLLGNSQRCQMYIFFDLDILCLGCYCAALEMEPESAIFNYTLLAE